MIRTISPQPTLWESVIPQCLMGLPGDLAEIDALLDDEAFFEPFRPFFDPTIGRPSENDRDLHPDDVPEVPLRAPRGAI